MASPPPPYANVTGISRAVMKDSPQESFANYDGNARAGELVVDLDVNPPTLYIGNAQGNLNQVTGGGGGSYSNSNVAAYLPTYTGNLSAANISVTGNIIPSANNTYNLGNNTNRFNNLYLTGNTIFLGSAILSSNASAVTFGIPGGGNVVLQGNANTTLGNIVSVNLDGNSGNVLSGAGTWVAAGGGGNASLPLANGSSNINIATANGNVTITANGTSTWTFDNTGTLTVPQNINGNGALQLQGLANGNTTINIGSGVGGDIDMVSNLGNINLYTANNQPWIFDQGGNLTAPGAINVGNMVIGTVPGDITADADTGVTFNVSGPNGGFAVNYLEEVGNANTSGGELAFSSETGNATYRISLSDDLGDGFATKIWRFDGNGNLTLPGNTFAVKYANGTQVSLGVLPLANGSSNIDISNANGNVSITANGTNTWTFDTTGNLTLPGNIVGASANVQIAADGFTWTFNNLGVVSNPIVTYSALPSANTAGYRAFISDGNLVATGNFGNAVSGGGSNTVPVYSDGSNWRIG